MFLQTGAARREEGDAQKKQRALREVQRGELSTPAARWRVHSFSERSSHSISQSEFIGFHRLSDFDDHGRPQGLFPSREGMKGAERRFRGVFGRYSCRVTHLW